MSSQNNLEEKDQPPLFGSWKRMYFFVLLNLAITVLIFYLVTLYLK